MDYRYKKNGIDVVIDKSLGTAFIIKMTMPNEIL